VNAEITVKAIYCCICHCAQNALYKEVWSCSSVVAEQKTFIVNEGGIFKTGASVCPSVLNGFLI